ncbi:class I SAM-dependent methyltransferase [Nocardioides sp. NPDC057772]|uniref:class I SAM-dependent methyltransferase n=1 Tax=Nocardioides sp. NPDC057772 TaxID=3346245 RepID=UPI003672CEF8
MKSRVELGAAQETLLIPLYGRAMEMRQRRPWMHDERAVELVESIDYDFAKFKKDSLVGSVLRGAIFDHWVSEFLREHPGGSVIEIGAGLNTRYERLDNGTARWLEIDLPDAMELRRRFFEDTERRTMHAGSITDPDWVPLVEELPEP